MNHQQEIRKAIAIEREALEHLEQRIGEQAGAAVTMMLACKGRVVVTGMGKAGHIGRKIAGTLASTGTPALFLHPAEAIHGDLGMVRPVDVILAISNSGETGEVVALLPHLKAFGVPIIAMTGNLSSTLARHSDIVLDAGAEREADPMGVAPTASTTVALALGDALAAALIVARGFNREDYAVFHPGGSLGRTLLSRVHEFMHTGDATPITPLPATLGDTICAMTAKRLGAAFITSADGKLAGILTDGDLRRILQKTPDPLNQPVDELMTRTPKTTTPDAMAMDALRLMEDHAITVLPVLDEAGRPAGALHMHDLVRAGLSIWNAKEE